VSLRDVEEGILRCIEQGEAEECKKLVDEFVKRGGDLLALISRATQLMRDLGKRFEEGEIFLPDVMMAAEAFSVLTKALGDYKALAEILAKIWSSAGFIEREEEIIKRDKPRIWGTYGVVERSKGIFEGLFFDIYYCPHRRVRIRLL
jgi:hypothetical protein